MLRFDRVQMVQCGAQLFELRCLLHVVHSLLDVLHDTTLVCSAPPHVLECIEETKCDHRIGPKCRNHRIDAVNWPLCVMRWAIDTAVHLLETRFFMRTHHNSRVCNRAWVPDMHTHSLPRAQELYLRSWLVPTCVVLLTLGEFQCS